MTFEEELNDSRGTHEPDDRPGQSDAQGLPLDIMNENNPYSDLNYGRKVGWHEGAEWGIKHKNTALKSEVERLRDELAKQIALTAEFEKRYNDMDRHNAELVDQVDSLREQAKEQREALHDLILMYEDQVSTHAGYDLVLSCKAVLEKYKQP